MKKIIISILAVSIHMGALAMGDALRGQELTRNCAGCHGMNGVPVQPMHPVLAGQKEMYLVSQITAFRDETRINPIMNQMVKNLTDQDIQDIAAYYSTINLCQ